MPDLRICQIFQAYPENVLDVRGRCVNPAGLYGLDLIHGQILRDVHHPISPCSRFLPVTTAVRISLRLLLWL